MKFPIVFLVLCFAATVFANFECEDGVPLKKNGCNSCTCHNGQLSACTEQLCIGKKYQKLSKCEVGSDWKYKCNDCWCVENIGTICTNNPC